MKKIFILFLVLVAVKITAQPLLSKDGRPIKEVEGIMWSLGGVPVNAPVHLAVECEIDAEFDLAASGQSLWASVFS